MSNFIKLPTENALQTVACQRVPVPGHLAQLLSGPRQAQRLWWLLLCLRHARPSGFPSRLPAAGTRALPGACAHKASCLSSFLLRTLILLTSLNLISLQKDLSPDVRGCSFRVESRGHPAHSPSREPVCGSRQPARAACTLPLKM